MRIVLVRAKHAGNLGATARAMANVGLSDLVLVAPQADRGSEEARKMSARAEPILLGARIVSRLEDALDGVRFVAATSCRPGLFRERAVLSPRQLAERLVAEPIPAAIVFGPEDYGLSNEDLMRCDATIRIPSHPGYESLNLAQAVMVCVYEWFAACEVARGSRVEPRAARPGRDKEADAALLATLIERFRGPLARIGYLNPDKPEQLLIALRSIFGRCALTRQDVQILMGLAQQIGWFADESGGNAKPAPPGGAERSQG